MSEGCRLSVAQAVWEIVPSCWCGKGKRSLADGFGGRDVVQSEFKNRLMSGEVGLEHRDLGIMMMMMMFISAAHVSAVWGYLCYRALWL